MKKLLGDFHDYELFLLFIVFGLVVASSNELNRVYFFEYKAILETIYKYQTFLTGLCAIFAALITALFIRKQISENNENHNMQLKIQNLLFKHNLNREASSTANCFSGEISSLIARTQDAKYLEHFQAQKRHLELGNITVISTFPLSSNYFIVFDNLSQDIGFLHRDFSKRICSWYSKAKGFVDTIVGINGGVYELADQEGLVDYLYKELSDLVEIGNALTKDLDIYAAEKKNIAIRCEKMIDQMLGV